MSTHISAFNKRMPFLISMALFAAFSQSVQATELLSEKEAVFPFSGFSDQLRYQGMLAAFSTVTQSYKVLAKTYSETIHTDEYGKFNSDAIAILFTDPTLYTVGSHTLSE